MHSATSLSAPTRWSIVSIALFQSLLLLVYINYQSDFSDPTRLVYLSLALTIPTMACMLLVSLRDKLFWFSLAAYSLLVLITSVYSGHQCSPDSNIGCAETTITSFVIPQIIIWFVWLFFASTGLRLHNREFPYSDLFNASWEHYLVVKLTAVFLGLFWGLLTLWSALFKLIGINYFSVLFFDNNFAFPASGVAVGLALAVFRTQVNAVDVLRRVLRLLMRWLLPVLATMSVLFIVALPFTGLESLWQTRKASLLLLWLICLLLFFFNAVFQDSEQQAYSPFFNKIIKWIILFTPVYIVLIAYALWLRVNQYGWSIERLWATIITLLLAGFVISYSYGLLRKRTQWLSHMTQTNRIMALVIVLVCLLVATPVLNLQRISAQSQLSLLESGKITFERLDLAYFRFDLGRAGHQALLDLKDSDTVKGDAKLLAKIETVMTKKNRWGAKVSQVAAITDSQTLKLYFEIYPQQSVVPDTLWQTLLDDKKQIRSCFECQHQCLLLAVDLLGDSKLEYVIFGQGQYTYQQPVYALETNSWHISGYVSQQYNRQGREQLLNKIKRGEYTVKAPQWRELEVGGKAFTFKRKTN